MMYTVSSELYRETAARLCDALDGESYYSGSLEFVFDGMECRLVVSVIAYRRREVAPEGLPSRFPTWCPSGGSSTPSVTRGSVSTTSPLPR